LGGLDLLNRGKEALSRRAMSRYVSACGSRFTALFRLNSTKHPPAKADAAVPRELRVRRTAPGESRALRETCPADGFANHPCALPGTDCKGQSETPSRTP
jgi:hypothetical protein